ncbi:MAG: hypothetical protein CM1200mP1_00810 [Candidatus Neomarinimicrobiota bacterium]|nr:MAG: hypothetical protein CM1200mP1_00810 [Candidatus Neomarinimicrobiota bacterium]
MKTYGIIAKFDDPSALLHAAEEVRDAGFKILIVTLHSLYMGWMMQWD